MAWTIAGLVGLLILGAMTTIVRNTPESVAKRCKVVADEFQNSRLLEGPRLSSGFSPPRTIFMRCDKLGVDQLYVVVKLEDWHFLDRAHSQGGEELQFVEIARNVVEEGVEEHIGVVVETSWLESRRSGFKVALYGRFTDKIVVDVPAFYVEGYLRARSAFDQAGA